MAFLGNGCGGSCRLSPHIRSLYLQCDRIHLRVKEYISQPLLEVAVGYGMQGGMAGVQFIDYGLKGKPF